MSMDYLAELNSSPLILKTKGSFEKTAKEKKKRNLSDLQYLEQ